MTVKEYKELRTWFGAQWQTRPLDAVQAQLRTSEATLARDQKRYEEEVQFRPSYAPAGQPTRSEAAALTTVRQSERFVRYLRTIVACTVAGKALPE